MAMITERLNELKQQAKNADRSIPKEDADELIIEIERLQGLEENRKRVHEAAQQGARGLKEQDSEVSQELECPDCKAQLVLDAYKARGLRLIKHRS